jgi:hypothetical protein
VVSKLPQNEINLLAGYLHDFFDLFGCAALMDFAHDNIYTYPGCRQTRVHHSDASGLSRRQELLTKAAESANGDEAGDQQRQ